MSYMHNIDPHYIIYFFAKKFKALRIMEDALKSYIESTTKKINICWRMLCLIAQNKS